MGIVAGNMADAGSIVGVGRVVVGGIDRVWVVLKCLPPLRLEKDVC